MADPDAAGKLKLGIAAEYRAPLVKLAIDTPRETLINTLNQMIDLANQAGNIVVSTTDSIGWEVQDFGKFRRYMKTITVSPVSIPTHARVTTAVLTIPDGAVKTKCRVFTAYDGAYSAHHSVGVETASATTWNLNLGNTYTDALTYSGYISVLVEEKIG